MDNPRHLSLTAEHFTPLDIVEAARKVMGGIDLDPATTVEANKHIRARRICTAKDNGFTEPWRGRVFLNPPGGKCNDNGVHVPKGQKGGKSSAKLWWQKLVSEFTVGRCTEAIFVAFSVELLQSTQVKPVGRLPLSFSMCFPSRRIAYLRCVGKKFVPSTQPPHASCIIYLSNPINFQSFADEFSQFGCCIRGAAS